MHSTSFFHALLPTADNLLSTGIGKKCSNFVNADDWIAGSFAGTMEECQDLIIANFATGGCSSTLLFHYDAVNAASCGCPTDTCNFRDIDANFNVYSLGKTSTFHIPIKSMRTGLFETHNVVVVCASIAPYPTFLQHTTGTFQSNPRVLSILSIFFFVIIIVVVVYIERQQNII
jgi:hypothetical protein